MIGKALQERRLVPIALSPLFFAALQAEVRARDGRPPSAHDTWAAAGHALPRTGVVVGTALAARVPRWQLCVLEAYYPGAIPLVDAASRRAEERSAGIGGGGGSGGGGSSGAPGEPLLVPAGGVGVAVEDMGLDFHMPGSGVALGPHDPDTPVTSDNVDEYVVALAGHVAAAGVADGTRCVLAGLHDVLDTRRLLMFTPSELVDAVCGQQEVAWTRASLLSSITWSHGYDAKCREAGWLVDTLVAFSQAQRRQFLQFVTGCPSLPSAGLAGLSRPLSVMRKADPSVVLRSEVDGSLPSASTCFHHLKLPGYSSAGVLQERLVFAMQNSTGIIDMT